MLVKNFHWIVIEDSQKKTSLVENILKESPLKYTHLNVKTHKSKHSTVSVIYKYLFNLRSLNAQQNIPGNFIFPGLIRYFTDSTMTNSIN